MVTQTTEKTEAEKDSDQAINAVILIFPIPLMLLCVEACKRIPFLVEHTMTVTFIVIIIYTIFLFQYLSNQAKIKGETEPSEDTKPLS